MAITDEQMLRIVEGVVWLLDTLQSERERREELEGALKPFARLRKRMEDEHPEWSDREDLGTYIVLGGTDYRLNHEHWIRARQALKGEL